MDPYLRDPAPVCSLKETRSLPFHLLGQDIHKRFKIGSGRQQFIRTAARRALRKRQRQARKINRCR